jgi:RimJ/RimL family protein N-acetyltransferase
MEIVTRRFLLRDFVELDRPSFLDYQSDPRSQTFYKTSNTNPEQATRFFDKFLRWADDRPRINYQLAIMQRQKPEVLVGCYGLRVAQCPVGEMELEICC